MQSVASVTMVTVAYHRDSGQQNCAVKAVISNSAGCRAAHYVFLLPVNNCDAVFVPRNSAQARLPIETACTVRQPACSLFWSALKVYLQATPCKRKVAVKHETPCGLVGGYQHFGETCCIHIQSCVHRKHCKWRLYLRNGASYLQVNASSQPRGPVSTS